MLIHGDQDYRRAVRPVASDGSGTGPARRGARVVGRAWGAGTISIMRVMGMKDPVVAEVFARCAGVFEGMDGVEGSAA